MPNAFRIRTLRGQTKSSSSSTPIAGRMDSQNRISKSKHYLDIREGNIEILVDYPLRNVIFVKNLPKILILSVTE